jgi:hypothetical protein
MRKKILLPLIILAVLIGGITLVMVVSSLWNKPPDQARFADPGERAGG